MQVRSVRSVGEVEAESILVGMYEGMEVAPGTARVLDALGAWAVEALEAAEFDGTLGKAVALPTAGALPSGEVVVTGLGDDVDLVAVRTAAATAMRVAGRARRVATTLHRVPLEGATRAVAEGVGLADYRFDRYRSATEERAELGLELVGASKGWRDEASEATVVVEAVALARDLVNEPAAGKGPLDLAQRLIAEAEDAGLEHELWSGERLKTEGLEGLLGVGAGSHREPCLLRLRHSPPGAKARLALVGKGIVFDSGGLSIKTADNMEKMKTDMAGAATVAAATLAAARLGLPVEVTAYLPLAENMPGGSALRPGDVLRIRGGKTIEVLNTDAEGRLVLADALSLAAEADPDLIVDVATLTGACRVALGDKIAGLWGSDEAVADQVRAAGETAGERLWPMPLPADYRSLLDSEVADMKNTGGRYGGAIAAALLLSEFVGERRWVHIDMAGPARSEKAEGVVPKGGTGFGVLTLVELARSL